MALLTLLFDATQKTNDQLDSIRQEEQIIIQYGQTIIETGKTTTEQIMKWIMNPDYTGKPIKVDWAALASTLTTTQYRVE